MYKAGVIAFQLGGLDNRRDRCMTMFQRSILPWHLALDVVVGVSWLLLITTTTHMGPPIAEAAEWTGGQRHAPRGCVGARLCCPGKNSTCRVQGPRANDRRSRTCYCDTACFSTKDCCADLQLACNISTSYTLHIHRHSYTVK